MNSRKESLPYFKDEKGRIVYIIGARIEEDGAVIKPANSNRPLNNYKNDNGSGNGNKGNGNGNNGNGKGRTLLYFQNPDGTISFSREDWNEAKEGFMETITRV